jgi:hypothetical protein
MLQERSFGVEFSGLVSLSEVCPSADRNGSLVQVRTAIDGEKVGLGHSNPSYAMCNNNNNNNKTDFSVIYFIYFNLKFILTIYLKLKYFSFICLQLASNTYKQHVTFPQNVNIGQCRRKTAEKC